MTPQLDAARKLAAQIEALGVPTPVAEAIEQLVRHHAAPEALRPVSTSKAAKPTSIGEVARQLHKQAMVLARTDRKFVSDLPVWHMLLSLIADEEMGRVPSVTDLCIASGVPPTTALRHIVIMEHEGLIVRIPDQRDQRRVLIRMTPEARVKLQGIIRSFCIPEPDEV